VQKATKGKTKAVSNTKAKAQPVSKAKTGSSTSADSIAGKKVIITGTIPGHDRKSAQAVVEDAGAHVEKSLNKQVQLVILGTNAGPDKLKKVEDLGIETIQWADLADKLGIEAAPEKKVADVDVGDAPDTIEGLNVICSGSIEGHTRSAVQKLLESAGAKYAKSLNKSVELVILGDNPGPDKLNKIAELGIKTCSFEALVEKLDLDVKEPPKKKAKRN
jgi:NAD-dependent DNA ligase